jgi:hypothetical protein
MSLSLAIAVNVIADLAIIALVAYVMSRAAKLTPHVPADVRADVRPAASRRRVRGGRARAPRPGAPQPARS